MKSNQAKPQRKKNFKPKFNADGDNNFGKKGKFASKGNNTGGGSRRKKKQREIQDPVALISKVMQKPGKPFVPEKPFSDFDLVPALKNELQRQGYELPTEIQEKAIPAMLQGHNLMGLASTGTGKTAAFLIPIINQLVLEPNTPPSLVIVPTRELALQVKNEFKNLTRDLKLFASAFIGGTPLGNDLSQLRRPNHIVIGTPGRLIDLYDRRALKLQDFGTLVVDEFDRMFDMGFVADVEKLSGAMTQRKQTLLFSATVNPKQLHIIDKIAPKRTEIKVNPDNLAGKDIDQKLITIPKDKNKFEVLLEILKTDEKRKVLIFAETRRNVDAINDKLKKSGLLTDQIHGEIAQRGREKALRKFKNGQVQILVATDVAARGIDVQNIGLVINYEVPLTVDSYVHRVGRTGRAGQKGLAYTMV